MVTDLTRVGRAVVDLIGASGLLAVLVIGAVSATALAVGSGSVGIKRALFAIGLLMTGVGTLLYRSRLKSEGDGRNGTLVSPSRGESRLRLLLEWALPDRFVLPPQDRFSGATKLVAGGVITLLVSYLMERVFIVGV